MRRRSVSSSSNDDVSTSSNRRCPVPTSTGSTRGAAAQRAAPGAADRQARPRHDVLRHGVDAFDVGEHEGEQDRDEDHVRQLLWNVLELQQRAPAEGERRGQGAGPWWPDAGGQCLEHHLVDGRSNHGPRWNGRRHFASSFWPSGLSTRWPVSARNTSSRVGWPTANSLTAMSALESSARALETRSG
jgi:hypothetical protein